MKSRIGSAGGAEREGILNEFPVIEGQIATAIERSAQFMSPGQLATLTNQSEKAATDLQGEKENLKSIESKLDQCQKEVEGREAQQQELKAAKDEDEARLQELLAKFEEISTESIGLEQRLAASMKSLDALLSEVQLTQDQKTTLQELSANMTGAGERLRELIMEYTSVKERLELLKQQHADLEEEYTRLVEQQLGE